MSGLGNILTRRIWSLSSGIAFVAYLKRHCRLSLDKEETRKSRLTVLIDQ